MRRMNVIDRDLRENDTTPEGAREFPAKAVCNCTVTGCNVYQRIFTEPMEKRPDDFRDLVQCAMLACPHAFVGNDPVTEVSAFGNCIS